MVLKRRFGDGDDDGSDASNSEPRLRLRPTSLFGDVSGISLPEFVARSEPIVRRVVQEEVEHAIQRFCHSSTRGLSVNQVGPSAVRAWQLHFLNKLPLTLFSSSKVESEESEVIKIVLVSTDSKEIIRSGPLASLKVEIIGLDGDFVAGEREEWTKEEFDACAIREREGKRPLVTGDLVITLRHGVAELDNEQEFMVIQLRVREAKSEAFMVKDHRSESYKKHHPPSLADEVWRLERIARDGAFHKRLAHAGISTVKDFLCLYYTDQPRLRDVLGGGISKKTWDTILEHATACAVDDKMYLYFAAAEGVAIVLNSIYKVIGATFDGQNYQNVDKLNAFQRRLVEDVKHQAYKHMDEWSPFNGQSFVTPAMASSSMQVEVLNSPTVGENKADFPVADQDLLRMQLKSDHMTTSAPNSFEVDNDSQLDFPLENHCYSLQDIYPTPNDSMIKDFFFGSCSEEYSAGPSGSLGSVSPKDLVTEGSSRVNMSKWQEEGFFLAPTNPSVDIVSSNMGFQFLKNGKPKARWRKLRAVIKWGISVRRVVAAKRLARPLYLDF